MTRHPSQSQLFQQSAALVRQLQAALQQLEQASPLLQLGPLAGREWYDLLRQKLVPQLGESAWLVVAVVGGTNIGKSVIFNHLAGFRASASSPLASGTRHPVCLVPEGFTDTHSLQAVFPDFELHAWSEASQALQAADRNLLFWRTAERLPPTLLILDTPDIDSDARVNWTRADAVRRSADVLIAVLTQQKYNDAAVKEFFRKASAEDKAVLVVFNQCLLPDDEAYWPVWLRTFCSETGLQPDGVYLAPGDRRAAEELRLPFLERTWPGTPQPSGTSLPGDRAPAVAAAPTNDVPRDLSQELSRLRFHEIRMRTLLGSLQALLHPANGVPGYLTELRLASQDLASTAERLSNDTVLKIGNWPTPANSCVVSEIRTWWQTRQEGWARRVNSVYNAVGAGILWPIRAARHALQGPSVPPLQDYRHREWSAILRVIEELYDKLQHLVDSGHPLIRARVQSVLQGSSRASLIARLRAQHDALDFELELHEVVDQEMRRFQEDSPDLFRFYRQLHNVSAAVRPMTSVVLFSLGFGPAGEAVAPLIADAAAQAVVHVVADVAGGATVALAGETAVSSAAGTGASLLQAWFQRLHAAFTARRADWLTHRIHSELLGTLPEELQAAARLPRSEAYLHVQSLLDQLQLLVDQLQPLHTGSSPPEHRPTAAPRPLPAPSAGTR